MDTLCLLISDCWLVKDQSSPTRSVRTSPLTCHLLRLRRQGRVLRQRRSLRQGRAPRQGRSLRRGRAPRQGRSLRQGTVPATPRQRRSQLPSLVQVLLAYKLSLGSSFLGYLLDFSSFSGRQIHPLWSRWRPRLLLMTPL